MTGPMGRNQAMRIILRQADAPRPTLWQQVVMVVKTMINRRATCETQTIQRT